MLKKLNFDQTNMDYLTAGTYTGKIEKFDMSDKLKFGVILKIKNSPMPIKLTKIIDPLSDDRPNIVDFLDDLRSTGEGYPVKYFYQPGKNVLYTI